jgi:hypothetical protein
MKSLGINIIKDVSVCMEVFSGLATTPRRIEDLTMDRMTAGVIGADWNGSMARRLDMHRLMLLRNKELHDEKRLPFGIFEYKGGVLLFRGDNVSGIQIQLPADGGSVGDGIYLTPKIDSALLYASSQSRGGREGIPTLHVHRIGKLNLLDLTDMDRITFVVGWLLDNTNMTETVKNGLSNGIFKDYWRIECAQKLLKHEVPSYVLSTEGGMGRIITELLYGLGYDGVVVGTKEFNRQQTDTEVLVYNPLDIEKVGELDLGALRVFETSQELGISTCLTALRLMLRRTGAEGSA